MRNSSTQTRFDCDYKLQLVTPVFIIAIRTPIHFPFTMLISAISRISQGFVILCPFLAVSCRHYSHCSNILLKSSSPILSLSQRITLTSLPNNFAETLAITTWVLALALSQRLSSRCVCMFDDTLYCLINHSNLFHCYHEGRK